MAREGVRLTRRYFAARAWDGYVISEAAPTANAKTDDELDAVLRANVGTVSHLAGSVAMSAKDAPYGVVDPDLKVKKVQGLRVVDASIMVSARLISFAVVLKQRPDYYSSAVCDSWAYSGASLCYC